MTTRAVILALACACGVSACSDPGPDAGAADTGASNTGHSGVATARCRAHADIATGIGSFVALASGDSGPHVFGTSGYWDGVRASAFALDASASVAWSGESYLVASGRNLTAWDATFSHHRTVRSFAPGTCDPTLVEIPGGVALVYRRLAHASDGCERGTGSVLVESLDRQGAPRNAVPAAAPSLDNHASAVRARWDAGRLVVQSWDENDTDRYDVLAADGSLLASGTGEHVACPRAGCIEWIGPGSENDLGGTEAPHLRASIFGGHRTFESRVEAETVATLAVRGDRVLLVTPSNEQGFPTSVWIYDVSRRQLATLSETDGEPPVTRWHLSRSPSDLRAMAQPSGFALVAVPSGVDPVLYRIDCDG